MDKNVNIKTLFTKNFEDWGNLKPKLDESDHKPPFVEEGNIWWGYIGENIGTEISGKGKNYARPFVVYQKLSPYCFLIIPCTTQTKSGSWYVPFVHNKISQVAVLSQVKVIDYRRLKNKIGDLDAKDFEDIKNGFENLYTKKSQK